MDTASPNPDESPAPVPGSPEMEALLAEAKISLERSQELWESAGFNEETLKAGYESLNDEEKAEYDRHLAEQKEELMRERRHARDSAAPKSKPPKTGQATRTRIRI